MNALNAHLIGSEGAASTLATPALVVDLKSLERNIQAMMAHCARVGVKLRPHAKTHKCAEIARRQMAAGAVGICCAKLGEAEALADAGIESILVTSPVVTRHAFARVARLNSRMKDLMVVVDSAHCVEGLASAVAGSGKVLKVLVDVDIGLHRTGIAPGQSAVALARLIIAAEGLSFEGLQGYAGQLQHVEAFEDRRTKAESASRLLAETRDGLKAAGIACPIISGGGTGTFNIDPETRVYTELQAGSYIFMDKQYGEVRIANAAPLPFETSLFVQTTVISATMPGLVTTDAGLKSFATEAGAPDIASGAPAGANYFFFGDEQGGLMLGGEVKTMALGSNIRCTAPHCDPTVNLYDFYHVVDGDRLIAIWPIEARGRSA